MRILVWMETHYPVIGGIQVGVKQYLPALAALGNEVVVVSSHFALPLPNRMVLDTIPVHRFYFHDALQSNNAALFIRERQRVSTLIREFAPAIGLT